jgi:hypothetical protein
MIGCTTKLAFCHKERGLSSLRRGWRTPDPSPSREAADQSGYALELCWVAVEEDKKPTPQKSGEASCSSDGTRTPPSECAILRAGLPLHANSLWSDMMDNAGSDGTSTPPAEWGISHPGLPGYADSLWSNIVDADDSEETYTPQPERAQLNLFPVDRLWSNMVDKDECNVAFVARVEAVDVTPPPPFEAEGAVRNTSGSTFQSMRNLMRENGSAGHPHACAKPCKYFAKARGCKDGAMCDHCHSCVWKPERKDFPGRKKKQKKAEAR